MATWALSSSFYKSRYFVSSWPAYPSSNPCSTLPLRLLRQLIDVQGRSQRRGATWLFVEARNSKDLQDICRDSVWSNFHVGHETRCPLLKKFYSSASAGAPIRSQRKSIKPCSAFIYPAVHSEALECSQVLSPTAAYVHLPFCRRRCFYCDFPIVAVGERTEQTKNHIDAFMSDYVDLVCREIAATSKNRSASSGSNALKTVFLGGGTPSLISVPLLAKIIQELKCHFKVASDAEISMEMDPGTFDREKLAGFLEAGVTRLSLGVQSFQSELLQACGRAHGLQDVYDAVDAIHWNDVKNWSLDLMASLPNQTLQQWEQSLQEAVSLKPAHISVYDLQIEEGTLFHRWFKAGQEPLPSDDKSAELYCTASRRLREAGFEHYEVSNYAMPGFQCRHNLVYWENQPFYAFGLGSTSYVDGQRLARPRKLKDYAVFVENLSTSSRQDSNVESKLQLEDQVLDTVMLSLRLARGLNLIEFQAKFGLSLTATLCNCLVPFVENGLVEALDAQRHTISSSLYIDNWKNAKLQSSKIFDLVVVGDLISSSEDSLVHVSVEEPAGGLTDGAPGNLPEGDYVRRAAFVRLTDPEGFLLSNEVISSIFAALPSGGGM